MVFESQSVAFACLLFAAKLYGLEIIFEEESESLSDNNEKEELRLVRNPKFDFKAMACLC